MKASIIINNFNYDQFLRNSIESALAQTATDVEVIVVDDGSSDDSRAVIEGFGDRIVALFKPNGGQASAINTGFAAARGEFIFMLDSDDEFLPDTVQSALAAFRESDVAVMWRLRIIDAAGGYTGSVYPGEKVDLGDGDCLVAYRRGENVHFPPTSGLAFRRTSLEKLMPIPENAYRICADIFLAIGISTLGVIRLLPRVNGHYRIHGSNNWIVRERLNPSTIERRLEMRSRRIDMIEKACSESKRDGLHRWMFAGSKMVLWRTLVSASRPESKWAEPVPELLRATLNALAADLAVAPCKRFGYFIASLAALIVAAMRGGTLRALSNLNKK